MAISRVILNKNNTTTVLMNLQGDTATAKDVISGKTFHLANGTQATGTATDIVKLIDGTITTYSNSDTVVIRDRAFNNCHDLTTIYLPNCTTIGNEVFTGCVSLSSADLSKLIDVKIYTFYLCSALSTVDLSSAKTIRSFAFGDTGLTSIELPAIETIEANAFNGSSTLAEIILSGETVATLGNVNAFSGTRITASTGSIKVPASLVDTYKADAKWSTFASQIEAIA